MYYSKPCEFIVGNETVYVHAELITQCSKPLDKMINGPMTEAQQGKVTLENVDLGTFLRFVQWLYHGFYDVGGPLQLRQPNDVRSLNDSTSSNGSPMLDPSPMSRNNDSAAVVRSFYVYDSTLKKNIIERQFTVRKTSKDNPQPRPNNHHEEDYSEVFLGHARLYVFADKYDIEKLKILAMEELYVSLAVSTMYQQNTSDIVALLRYIYSNTAVPKDGTEDLRSLMTEYIETEIDSLIQDKDLEVLMSEDASMLADIMGVVRRKFARFAASDG